MSPTTKELGHRPTPDGLGLAHLLPWLQGIAERQLDSIGRAIDHPPETADVVNELALAVLGRMRALQSKSITSRRRRGLLRCVLGAQLAMVTRRFILRSAAPVVENSGTGSTRRARSPRHRPLTLGPSLDTGELHAELDEAPAPTRLPRLFAGEERDLLSELLRGIPGREAEVLRSRWSVEGRTPTRVVELSRRMGLSTQRIHQLERSGLVSLLEAAGRKGERPSESWRRCADLAARLLQWKRRASSRLSKQAS